MSYKELGEYLKNKYEKTILDQLMGNTTVTDNQYILMRELVNNIHKLMQTSLPHLDLAQIFAAMTQAIIEAAALSPRTDSILATVIEGLNQSEAMVRSVKDKMNG